MSTTLRYRWRRRWWREGIENEIVDLSIRKIAADIGPGGAAVRSAEDVAGGIAVEAGKAGEADGMQKNMIATPSFAAGIGVIVPNDRRPKASPREPQQRS